MKFELRILESVYMTSNFLVLNSSVASSEINNCRWGRTMLLVALLFLSLNFDSGKNMLFGEIIKFTIFSSIVAVNKYGIASLISK
jgi:hypothetical protein